MFKPHEVVILSTGSQGEPRSAMALMALDNHPFLKVEQGDTVVISARIIPGNEKAIGNVRKPSAQTWREDIPRTQCRCPRFGTRVKRRPEIDAQSLAAQVFYADAR